MTAVPKVAITSPAALLAFLRGVERRAVVLVELQTGTMSAAQAALPAAIRIFGAEAVDCPFAEWSIRFWSLLCGTPVLRRPPLTGQRWPKELASLQAMAVEDRLALLLRIVAGLDEAQAAVVLGKPLETYYQALARACPRDVQGRPNPAAWRALAEAAQQRVRSLSIKRLVTTTVLPSPSPKISVAESAVSRFPAPIRFERNWVVIAGLALGVIFMLNWAWNRHIWSVPESQSVSEGFPAVLPLLEDSPVVIEALPDYVSSAPPQVISPDLADRAMLEDSALEAARQADFFAWYVAGQPIPPDESDSAPVVAFSIRHNGNRR
ncbi:sigma-70 region 4 domain-containing protein [Xylella fastidiosa]|uniref:sigma-70 region 4 domain-containing protein n=1 Tax=Xylella fastidiosa TaxID=2371 RepID=UPI0004DCBC3B|nr:sigma-70 region 4 domain-containing protein [Xylella fastidiosa]KFA40852.1 hypothetical protein DF22_002525 [Xylella fastidiosa]MDD0908988.1 sigma-70 region 4 domain-containing protein [Xylella fastidiosa subsp. multiplex]MDD0929040.1 sigma-70 region 4 domain-containing protein [Xylella fastidiosa subsp. multiplex]MDS9988729.1 sigma-70 region 4 domain-containing protein [Xylella fastidiosa]QTX27913.1 sigma-70 region 4 domain-containing protein [Xylella fastidiosa subsp. multiplex]